MSMFYYLDRNGQQAGPVPAENLGMNGVTTDTLVWKDGMPGWAPANTVSEILPYLKPAGASLGDETVLVNNNPQPQQPAQQYQQNPQPQNAYQQQYHQPVQQPVQQQYQQPSGAQPPMPSSNLALAIFTTLCCCLPFGIVGIIKASKVSNLYAMGQYQAAQLAAAEAKKWSLIGLISGLVVQVLYVIIYGAAIASAF